MGFLSKIGNVLQDTASFAAPAGLALGATALTGGNPFAGKALLAALGAGAKGLQANEQEERARKMMKRQNQNNATANLINTLSPTARYQPNQAKAPRAGMLETLSGGVGMGVDAFQTAQMLQQAAERAARQDRLLDLQIGEAERASEMATGVDKAASRAAMQQRDTDRLTGLVQGTKPGTPMKDAGRSMLNATPSQSFGGWGGADSLRREMSTPTTGAEQTGFNQFMKARSDDQFDRALDVERIDLARQARRATDQSNQRDWELQRLGQLQRGRGADTSEELGALRPSAVSLGQNTARIFNGTLTPEVLRKQVKGGLTRFGNASPTDVNALSEDAMNAALTLNAEAAAAREARVDEALKVARDVASTGDYGAAVDVFINNPNMTMTRDEIDKGLLQLAAVSKTAKLDADSSRKLAGLLALRRGLTRIEELAQNPALDENFGMIQGRITELSKAASSDNLDPELLTLLTNIGFTAEQAVRLFSGAAVRTDEEERFREDFIGALSGGRQSLLTAIPAFRMGLEDLQIGIAEGAMAQRSGNLLFGLSSDRLMQLVAENNEGISDLAEDILRKRGVIVDSGGLPNVPNPMLFTLGQAR